ncbi:HK97 gp10 family phage protein [Curtobacterium flaccumfaciens]|uniref:HK97 gp10 family phage protein n=1 Tax=Curtobacterium flaccumfaciens TaxID=2035 RepID=UPI00188BE5B3|nr:HK97 gp10 family phage protein [Curtobacterium flaccumfaciens]MBF4628895.1 HK97 gp10 family phage protein [Curtobacterium flaccumfaciens]
MQFNERYFDELLMSPGVDRLVGSITDGVAADARANAPVDTGAYRSGIVHTKKRSSHRIVHLVKATDPKSLIIEARTGNLSRALRRRKR